MFGFNQKNYCGSLLSCCLAVFTPLDSDYNQDELSAASTVYLYMVFAAIFWSAAVLSSFLWSTREADESMTRSYLAAGRSFFGQVVVTREWNAVHGGVYVPVSEDTKPNPYLNDPFREIDGPDGKQYTKVNPAFMTRQISEIAEDRHGVKFHITSLNPLNPNNRAKEWEQKALMEFEHGSSEYSGFEENDAVFRYMAPLYTDKVCLPCHIQQGYKEGEVRGGISVTIEVSERGNHQVLMIIHLAALLIGLLAVSVFGRLLAQKQRELARAMNKAKEGSLAKSKFLANMSHEIRTPMNAIIGLTDLALDHDLSPKQADYLKKIGQASSSLLGIINDILDFSKIEADSLGIEHVEFDLCEIIESLPILFETRANKKGLQLLISVDPDLPSRFKGDPLRLKQVLVNLVSNAVKFTEQGKVLVKVGPAKLDKESFMVSFEVEDSGIGIEQDILEEVFSSFTQADASTTRRFGGTGLGLAISRKLTRLMGGEIIVSSQPGKGTVFSFTVRLGIVEGASLIDYPSCCITSDPKVPRDELPGLHGVQVLLVEDNSINRQVAKEILLQSGAEVELATNGWEAFKAVRDGHFEAVLMDVQMPEMDGLAATKLIRDKLAEKDLPIIAMTANAVNGDREECLTAGMNDYVSKPINRAVLLNCLARWTGRHPEDIQPASTSGSSPDSDTSSGADVLDIEAGIHRLAGNEELYFKLLEEFLRENRQVVEKIQQALDQQDQQTAIRLAHTVKGIAGNIEARNLYKAALALEMVFRNEEEVGDALAFFEKALGVLVQRIQER